MASNKGGSGAQKVMPTPHTRPSGKPIGQVVTPKTLGGKKA